MAGERTLPGIGLTGFWTAKTAGWKVGMDDNMLRLSALVQTSVLSRTTALPASPADGAIYIVPSNAAQNANAIAVRDNAAWSYFTPMPGTRAFVRDTNSFVYWSGTAWTAEASGGGGSGGIADAPSDGTPYARKDAAWVAVPTIQGPKGDTGLQGPKGDKGDTGAAGGSGSRSVTEQTTSAFTVASTDAGKLFSCNYAGAAQTITLGPDLAAGASVSFALRNSPLQFVAGSGVTIIGAGTRAYRKGDEVQLSVLAANVYGLSSNRAVSEAARWLPDSTGAASIIWTPDRGATLLTFNSDVSIALPSTNNGDWPIGTELIAVATNSNVITMTAGAGAQLQGVNGPGSVMTSGRTGASLRAIKIGDFTWQVFGDAQPGLVDSTANYTIQDSDGGKHIRMGLAGANTVTVPAGSKVGVNVPLTVRQVGAGTTTIVAASGVTITYADTLAIRKQHAEVKLRRIAANVWEATGDFALAP